MSAETGRTDEEVPAVYQERFGIGQSRVPAGAEPERLMRKG
ncbi:hypothetical protein [Streptomyces sp. NPDC001450]